MNAVLIFDADNTLWDTNAVFREAQLSLLRVFAKAGFFYDEGAELEQLRIIDSELVSQLGRFEYDFYIMATAVAYFYSRRMPVKEAARQAISDVSNGLNSELSSTISEAHQHYEKALKQIPPLFPDTEAVLSSIHACKSDQHPIAVLIFSDGNPSRLERILQAYSIRERCLFDEIIIGNKAVETFGEAKQTGMKYLTGSAGVEKTLFVMVGDSVQRDIKPANKAGYITVYKPAHYFGQETPREEDERPKFTINALSELPPILKDIGILA